MAYSKTYPFYLSKGLLFKAAKEADRFNFNAMFGTANAVGLVALQTVRPAKDFLDWRKTLVTNNNNMSLGYPECISLEYENQKNNKVRVQKTPVGGICIFAKDCPYFELASLTWQHGILFSYHLINKDTIDLNAIEISDKHFYLSAVDGCIVLYDVKADFDGNIQSDYFKSLVALTIKTEPQEISAIMQVLGSYLEARSKHNSKSYIHNEVIYYHFNESA